MFFQIKDGKLHFRVHFGELKPEIKLHLCFFVLIGMQAQIIHTFSMAEGALFCCDTSHTFLYEVRKKTSQRYLRVLKQALRLPISNPAFFFTSQI